MSTYTTTIWEYLKSCNDFTPAPIPEVIEKHRDKIFEFDYPTPKTMDKEEFKKWFETTFITQNLTRCIGFGTMEEFKIKLWGKLLNQMPIFVREFDLLIPLTMKEMYRGKFGTETIKGTDNDKVTSKTKDVNSNFPVNLINADGDIGSVNYADRGSINDNSRTSNRGYDESRIYDYTTGNALAYIIPYSKEVRKLFENIFNEFNDLFLGVM